MAWIELALLLPAGAFLYAGNRWGQPLLVAMGALCLALLTGLHGVDMIVTRRAEFRTRGGIGYAMPVEVFKGRAAQLWGLAFLAIAALLLVLAFATAFAGGDMQTLWARVFRSPAARGLALAVLGGVLSAVGTARVMAGTAGLDYGIPAWLANLQQRLAGALMLLCGGGLALLGLAMAIAPDALAAAVRGLVGFVL
jgi:hypothetical protein